MAAKKASKRPTWAQKKKQIRAAMKRIATATAALKAAQKALAKAVSGNPGGGPNVKD